MCGVLRIYQSVSENGSLPHITQNKLQLVLFVFFTSSQSRGEQSDAKSTSKLAAVPTCAKCLYTLIHVPMVHRNTYYVGPSQYLTQVFFFSREDIGITLEPGLFGALLPHCVVALLVFRGVSRYKNLSFRLF